MDRAESVFQHILSKHPDDADFLFALASMRIKQNRIDEAEQLLRHLTDVRPDHVTAWNNLAAILADDPARIDEALACIDRAIASADQPIATLLDTKAVILLQLGRDQEATDLLRQALSLARQPDARFHFHLAVALWRQGHQQPAQQAWRRAQELGVFDAYLTVYERQLTSDLAAALKDPIEGS